MDVPLLVNFDPVADGGAAPLDIRAFKDVRPPQMAKSTSAFSPNGGMEPL